jgi:hypothetical protein
MHDLGSSGPDRPQRFDTSPKAGAAFWIARQGQGPLTVGEARRLIDWMTIPANVVAYDQAHGVWRLMDDVGTLARRRRGVSSALDASAVGLSALCLVHCLALPLLALALPLAASWARAEWVHVLFVSLAAPIALLALIDWSTLRPFSWRLIALAGAGLGLMLAGAVEFPTAGWERPLTVLGGLILASAHIFNWRRRHDHSRSREAPSPS